MIIRSVEDPKRPGRFRFELGGFSVRAEHVVRWEITAERTFAPHSHQKPEIWYVTEGRGFFHEAGREYEVHGGDCLLIESGVAHGMRTDSRVAFLCLG